MTSFLQSGLRWLWITVLVIVIDHLTKSYALQHLTLFEPYNVLPFLNFDLAYNTGSAFGFLNTSAQWQRWMFGSLALIVTVGLSIWLSKLSSKQRWMSIAIALVIGGALGNLLDRILYHHVIDFIDFYILDWHFATFNVADSAVTIGAIMLCIDALFFKNKIKQTQ